MIGQGARLGAFSEELCGEVPGPVHTRAEQDSRKGQRARRQVNKTYRRSRDLAFGGAKIAQICGEGNALFQEDFWTAQSTTRWLAATLGGGDFNIRPPPTDASFRRIPDSRGEASRRSS